MRRVWDVRRRISAYEYDVKLLTVKFVVVSLQLHTYGTQLLGRYALLGNLGIEQFKLESSSAVSAIVWGTQTRYSMLTMPLLTSTPTIDFTWSTS